MVDKVHYRGQIDRILSSHALHGSESLCKLLRYPPIIRWATPVRLQRVSNRDRGLWAVKTIFDPHVDATVRVQAGRLRGKLAEYYASEGAEDQPLVDFPRGTYALAFTSGREGPGETMARSTNPQ